VITDAESGRLATTGERVRTLNAETRAERSRRNTLIREMIDRGEKYRAVGRAAGLSNAAVAGIMASAE
jgi:hypothetical protein